jgi:hypothetical protein
MRSMLFSVIFLIFVSCVSPYPNLRLTPAGGGNFWESGREYAGKTIDGISVRISYERNENATLIFNLIIQNNSSKEYLFIPTGISCVNYKSENEVPADFNIVQSEKKIYAYDPEILIANTYADIKKENARYDNARTADAVFGILGAVSAVASKDSDAMRQNAEDNEEMENNARQDALYHRDSIRDYQNRISMLETQSARKTTLMPKKSIQGRVFIPAKKENGVIALNIPAGNSYLVFIFNQVVVPVPYP